MTLESFVHAQEQRREGGMRRTTPAGTSAMVQLTASGYATYLQTYVEADEHITGRMDLAILPRLLADPRLANGVLYQLHRNVGLELRDFRSYRGTFGPGSLQIVLDEQTGAFYADVDTWNPYADLVGFLAHGLFEVLPLPWRRRMVERT